MTGLEIAIAIASVPNSLNTLHKLTVHPLVLINTLCIPPMMWSSRSVVCPDSGHCLILRLREAISVFSLWVSQTVPWDHTVRFFLNKVSSVSQANHGLVIRSVTKSIYIYDLIWLLSATYTAPRVGVCLLINSFLCSYHAINMLLRDKKNSM